MAQAVVLGSGMVGSVIAADLVADFDVTVADASPTALRSTERRTGARAKTIIADLSDPAVITDMVRDADIAIGALPSRLGRTALQAVVEAGVHYCDISFMAENPLDLDEVARAEDVTAVVDCGVAPGLSNMLAARGAARVRDCASLSIYVGGVPRHPKGPFKYKAAFAPSDVLEEYVRPARLVEQGQVVEREALSEIEPISFPGLGTMEAFNTDGLRTLIQTLAVPNMREKTVRWPGHAELMRAFREAGLFGEEPITVETVAVRPREVMAALLFPQWTYDEGEEDLTVFRVTAVGGGGSTVSWEMVANYDAATRTSSMSRTTAFPCAIVARMIIDGTVTERGVIPPERIGEREDLMQRVLGELQARGVEINER